MNAQPSSPSDPVRRRLLTRSLKLLALLGLGFALWPFIAAFLPDASVDAERRQRWQRLVDLSALQPGEQLRIDDWPGGPVAVHRRTEHERAGLTRIEGQLYDPRSQHSLQSDALPTTTRSVLPEFFVFIPAETTRGCQVRYIPANKQPKTDIAWNGGFVDLCNGSLYDTAGRIYRHHRTDGQQNLSVPAYTVVGDLRIRLEGPAVGNTP